MDQVRRLNTFWGELTVDKINKLNSNKYKKDRNINTVRLELEILRSMVNFAAAEGILKLTYIHNYAIPKRPEPRVHFLSSLEVVALYRAALSRRHSFTGRRTAKHIGRFIAVAIATGTRSARISSASYELEAGRPWIDLENGIFYRKAFDISAPPNKRADPIRIPDRLLTVMRRWYRDDKAKGEPGYQYLIHYDGRPVDCRRGFYTLSRSVFGKERAAEINRHTLKHTCVTWLLSREATVDEVADYVSTTPAVIRRVYGHLIPGQHGKINSIISKKRVGSSRSRRGQAGVDGRQRAALLGNEDPATEVLINEIKRRKRELEDALILAVYRKGPELASADLDVIEKLDFFCAFLNSIWDVDIEQRMLAEINTILPPRLKAHWCGNCVKIEVCNESNPPHILYGDDFRKFATH